jgi:hypothetical protein
MSEIPDSFRTAFEEEKRTRTGWSVIMAAFNDGDNEEDIKDNVKNAAQYGDKSIPLQVPKTAKKSRKAPKMNMEDDYVPFSDPELNSWTSQVPADLLERLGSLFERVTRAEMNIISNHQEAADDLTNLQVKVAKTEVRIGPDPPVSEIPFQSVWSGVRHLFFESSSSEGILQDLKDRVSSIEPIVNEDIPNLKNLVNSRLKVVERLNTIVDNMKMPFKSVLEFIKVFTPANGDPAGATLNQRIILLEQSLQNGTGSVPSRLFNQDDSSSTSTEVMALSATVSELKELVARLEARQSSEGLFVADESFPSYLDTEAWVALNVAGYRYGLFVDGHTLLENLMTAEHVEYSTTIDEAHKVSRSNFTSGYEARVHGSFLNVLPSFFGKGNANVALPGIATYKEWSTGGTGGTRGGLRQFYSQKLKESKKQLHSAITTRLSRGVAQKVALALLEESYEFCMGLGHFMDTFMQDLIEHGHPVNEAWSLSSDCVLRIYGDISDARISGRGARDGTDDLQTAAACIWATLSAHRVMREYLRLDFDRHPSVSSALTRYQTKHSPQDAINKLEKRVGIAEGKMAGAQAKVDAMNGRVKTLEQKL